MNFDNIIKQKVTSKLCSGGLFIYLFYVLTSACAGHTHKIEGEGVRVGWGKC